MVVIEVRHRQGGEADEEEKEKEEKEEKEEKRKAADIKSNNPHLAGGEKRENPKIWKSEKCKKWENSKTRNLTIRKVWKWEKLNT